MDICARLCGRGAARHAKAKDAETGAAPARHVIMLAASQPWPKKNLVAAPLHPRHLSMLTRARWLACWLIPCAARPLGPLRGVGRYTARYQYCNTVLCQRSWA